MITCPLWLFAGLCGLAGLALLGAISGWVRAERLVDRILVDELARPVIGDQEAADRADRGQR